MDAKCNVSGVVENSPHPLAFCANPSAKSKVDVLLVGDSHAQAVSEIVGHELRGRDIGFYESTYSSCPPLKGLKRFNSSAMAPTFDCENFSNLTYSYATSIGISTVVLTARFQSYLHGTAFNNGEGGVERFEEIVGEHAWVDAVERINSKWNDAERRLRVLSIYEQGIRELARKFNVVLVYPVPEAGWNVPSQAFKTAYFSNGGTTLTTSYSAYLERTKEVNALFDRLIAELPNVHGARVHEALCSDETGRCVNADINGVYYYDDDHLSNAGARLVAPVIVEAIKVALIDGN